MLPCLWYILLTGKPDNYRQRTFKSFERGVPVPFFCPKNKDDMKNANIFDLLDLIWSHAPDIAVIAMFIGSIVWLTIKVTNFGHRLNNLDRRVETTERLCNDINNRQLPEIRDRLTGIEKILIRLDTFLCTKFEDYPKK